MVNRIFAMKKNKLLYVAFAATLLLGGCSEGLMDTINQERNNATDMTSKNLLPSVEVRTAFQTTGTDYAWYASIYIEQSAGTWGQQNAADQRIAQNDASIFNNNWVSSYSILNTCKIIEDKCGYGGVEYPNFTVLGIAEVFDAYNLAVLTDLFGDVPYTDALKGAANFQPKFDKSQDIYPIVQAKLDSAIAHLTIGGNSPGQKDYIYGGNTASWIRAAWSLKARYYMRLANVDAQASNKALSCMANAFTSNADGFIFNNYDPNTSTLWSPWFQFYYDRSGLAAGMNLDSLMVKRNDPRIPYYFDLESGVEFAPNGTADQTQGGIYYFSFNTEDPGAPTPIMTYHELLFIKAEAEFNTGDGGWQTTLQQAIESNFVYHGLTSGEADTYFTNDVLPRLTAGNELNELYTQKYIGYYEAEAIEAYNDYRRTGVPAMTNPNNLTATGGFVNRYPYGLSDVSSNGANTPQVNVYTDKLFWAK